MLEVAFARGADRFGFRLVHDSIQSNHRHLIAEAADRAALVYVLNDARHHGVHFLGMDPFSSDPWFDGWARLIASVASAR